jgi:sec-independent protein translocase protein TatA
MTGGTDMGAMGIEKLVIVLLIVLVLFGGSKIPEMMRGLGQGMKEFKKATRDEDEPTTTVVTTTTDNANNNRTSL